MPGISSLKMTKERLALQRVAHACNALEVWDRDPCRRHHVLERELHRDARHIRRKGQLGDCCTVDCGEGYGYPRPHPGTTAQKEVERGCPDGNDDIDASLEILPLEERQDVVLILRTGKSICIQMFKIE